MGRLRPGSFTRGIGIDRFLTLDDAHGPADHIVPIFKGTEGGVECWGAKPLPRPQDHQ
ncbi:MAG: hypothetical protein J7L22_07900 [Candidatus Marinimicrobia bacterium]|nr:hypothetical protein [Candidatus Neomarinimicrobiota bacterium]